MLINMDIRTPVDFTKLGEIMLDLMDSIKKSGIRPQPQPKSDKPIKNLEERTFSLTKTWGNIFKIRDKFEALSKSQEKTHKQFINQLNSLTQEITKEHEIFKAGINSEQVFKDKTEEKIKIYLDSYKKSLEKDNKKNKELNNLSIAAAVLGMNYASISRLKQMCPADSVTTSLKTRKEGIENFLNKLNAELYPNPFDEKVKNRTDLETIRGGNLEQSRKDKLSLAFEGEYRELMKDKTEKDENVQEKPSTTESSLKDSKATIDPVAAMQSV